LAASGVLCVLGLLGPALANPSLRLIGVFGYGVVFPVACVLIGFVFRDAHRAAVFLSRVTEVEDQAHGPAVFTLESARTVATDRFATRAGSTPVKRDTQ